MIRKKKMVVRGQILFSLYIYIENFKIFLPDTTGPILILIVQAVMIRRKNMAARGRGLFSLYI